MCPVNVEQLNPFTPSGLFYYNSLDRSISKSRLQQIWHGSVNNIKLEPTFGIAKDYDYFSRLERVLEKNKFL